MFDVQSLNPYTGKVLFQSRFHSEDSVNQMISLAFQAFQEQQQSMNHRLEVVVLFKDLLIKEKESLANLMTQEMGKPIQEAVAEIEKCISLCSFYVEHAGHGLAPRWVSSSGPFKSRVEYHALGTILAIMPWNFPFWQVLRVVIPAMIVGNTLILKHAPNVSLCALKIEALFLKAGALKGVFQTVLASEAQVEKMLADFRIRAVSLTGSEKAGRAVASIAGKNLKKQVLELGGSDPFLVMPSADVKEAAYWARMSRLINNGQSCIAAKRFIVHEKVYDAFVVALKDELAQLKIGDPLDPTVHIGPLARVDLVKQLKDQVAQSVAQGAVVEAEYTIAEEHHLFAPITILSGVKKGMPAYEQELFGPVFTLFKVGSIEEAILLANDSVYGLGASVWTKEEREQVLCEEKLEAGSVFINAMVRSDPGLPFGGIKHSGYGRELSEEGLREFCNVKTMVHRVD